MDRTRAALVTSFDEPPHYLPLDLPPRADGEIVVDLVAAGLHPRVRSGAAGRHYTSTGRLPLVPGIDGVGRRDDGRLVYFVADDEGMGTMAERVIVDPRRTLELPDGIDAATIAAGMNPAMSSWVALRRRAPLEPGQDVLVLGATGSAGSTAVRIARLLGAGRVVAAGRDAARLEALRETGADGLVRLGDDTGDPDRALASAAAEVDVVLDYLWGEPTERAIVALLTARADRDRPLQWVQVGSVAGPEAAIPSAALRSADLRLLGSGQGSVAPRAYLAELRLLVDKLVSGAIPVVAETAPLAEVETVWTRPETPGRRLVLVP